jgi:hypothetical protein
MKQYMIIVIACSALLASACTDRKNNDVIQAGTPVQIDAMPASSPYLTKDTKGNIVMSWVRSLNDSSSVFCYAVSADGGNSFGRTISIPSSNNIHPHSENLPKIIFKPSGEIIALWGAANPDPRNKYAGLVFYSQSFDEGRTWGGSQPLVSDTAGYDQRYYDVALLPGNEVAIIWLDNRKDTGKEGAALYFASTKGRDGFRDERMIGQFCCPCCRTDLYVDNKGSIHVLYRGIIKDSIRDMVHSVSVDGGNNFSEPKRISNDDWVINGCPHTGPAMTENKEGMHFTWFTGGRSKGCFYTRSNNNGSSFIQHDRISALGSHPQVASASNGDILVAWDEAVQAGGKSFKKIGLQRRSASGVPREKGFITADTLTASYPVIASLNDGVSVVAYSLKRSGKNYIMYQRVNLN